MSDTTSDTRPGKALAPDLAMAADFLNRLRPGGPWVLLYLVPDTTPVAQTFHQMDGAVEFIAQHNTDANIYFSINPTKSAMNKKPSKADIARVEYLHVDADPNDDETPEQFKARLLPQAEAFEHKPTFITDSGNGIQLLVQLEQPVALNGAESIADIEERNRALALAFGADPVTRNVDRIFRIPGSTCPLLGVKRTCRAVMARR